MPGFFFDRAEKTQGRKKSKLKGKTQNSSEKLKYSANFGVIYCKNQGKGPKNKGETTKMAKSRLNIIEWVQFESKNFEFLKFSNIPSKLMGKTQ